jgi:hypothetical protein
MPRGQTCSLGFIIYPMLIVFRAEHAACLKHSSLFKVNWPKSLHVPKHRRCFSFWLCGLSGFLPSLVGRDPKKRSSSLVVVCVTPKLSKELAVSVPEKVDLMVLVSSSASILSPIDHFVVLTRD